MYGVRGKHAPILPVLLRGYANAFQALLVVLKVLADFGDEAFVKVIVAICQDLKVEDADVW